MSIKPPTTLSINAAKIINLDKASLLYPGFVVPLIWLSDPSASVDATFISATVEANGSTLLPMVLYPK